MAITNAQKYELNGAAVPDGFKPHWCIVEYPRTTATNLMGEPVGATGYATARLWWEGMMPLTAFRYWFGLIGDGFESVWLDTVTIPDTRLVGLLSHSTFQGGVLHRIQVTSGSKVVIRKLVPYIEGGAELMITELGRVRGQ